MSHDIVRRLGAALCARGRFTPCGEPGCSICDPEPSRGIEDDIADALGTAERGQNLVAVARDAHRAEQELARLQRVERELDAHNTPESAEEFWKRTAYAWGIE